MSVRTRLLVIGCLLLLGVGGLFAADLPRWTDDSGVALTLWPRRFSPERDTTNLVARVFHPIDSPATVVWNITVRDAGEAVVRQFDARQTFQPGEAIIFAATWNGRDGEGRRLPNGAYHAELSVELRAAGPRISRQIALADDETEGRVPLIRQRFSETVILDSTARFRGIEVHAQAPHDPGVPYNFYYGTLHNQTSYSDGGHPNTSSCASSTIHGGSDVDPAGAYNYARFTGGLDFLGITDHNHQFNDACSGCSATQIVQRYQTGLTAASNATVNGSFVGIYGMEWGYISNPDAGFPNEGHVGVYESPVLFGWEPSTCTVGSTCYYDVFTASSSSGYAPMYTKALQNPSAWGAFGQFNHPSDGTKSAAGQGVDFNNLQYTTDGDDFIHTLAVISGPATDYSTTTTDTGALYAGEPVNGPNYAAYTSTDMYNRVLGAGYHVAPVADPDVHCANYGTSTRDRTVILASSLTKAALFDAIHNRRVYATSDANTQLVYTMNVGSNTYWMGAGGIRANGPVSTSGAITLHVSVWDPDGDTAVSIKLKEPVPGNTNGADTVVATSTSSPFDFTFTPPAGNHAYYVYVTLNNGDRLWSAPIWINQGATADTTPPTTAITSPAGGATLSGTTSVTASASDNVGVTRVEFYLDNVLQTTDTTSPYSWSWNTTTSANGSHALNSKAFDAAGNSATSATVTVTVNNVADTTPPTAPSNLTASIPTSGTAKRKINLAWTASTDDVGVAGYQIWRATSAGGPFSQIATTTATSYTNSGLTSGTTYWYSVKAYDAAGNVSPASNTASATAK